MLFFRRRHAGARNAALTVPPPDEVPHVHGADKVLSLAQVLSQQSDFHEILRLIASKGPTLFNAESFTIDMAGKRKRVGEFR